MVAWVCRLGGNPSCPLCTSPWHHAAPSWRAADSHHPLISTMFEACPWYARRQIKTRLWWRILRFQSLICKNEAGWLWEVLDFQMCMDLFWFILRILLNSLKVDQNGDIENVLAIPDYIEWEAFFTSIVIFAKSLICEAKLLLWVYTTNLWFECEYIKIWVLITDENNPHKAPWATFAWLIWLIMRKGCC